MHLLALAKALLLVVLANGAPVAAKRLRCARFSWPLDFGRAFFDRKPLFGASKTWRGILLALLVTSAAAPLFGLDWKTGAMIAAAAMAGDLLSSFVKRRLALAPSSRATGLDQIPESLFPLLACAAALEFSAADIAAGTSVFFLGEILLSRLLYRVRLRDRPY